MIAGIITQTVTGNAIIALTTLKFKDPNKVRKKYSMEYSKFCHKVRNYFLEKRLNAPKISQWEKVIEP